MGLSSSMSSARLDRDIPREPDRPSIRTPSDAASSLQSSTCLLTRLPALVFFLSSSGVSRSSLPLARLVQPGPSLTPLPLFVPSDSDFSTLVSSAAKTPSRSCS